MNLPDRNQNFWELACISGTAHGLPSMVIGALLSQRYGPFAALTSIIIGNFILWFLGLSIISMAGHREHAIQNIRGYLGKTSSIFAALIWVFAFVIWYTVQIKSAAEAISNHFHAPNGWIIGGGLGFFVAVLGTGGIKLIRRVCVFSLPLMIGYIIYAIATMPQSIQFRNPWVISIPAILTIVVTWLPGTVNLPTFFRHSRSRADSVLGLSLLTFFHAIFQLSTVLMNVDDATKYFPVQTGLATILAFGFIVIAYSLSNLLNIYYASAGWETISPIKRSSVEYFLVGLLGTTLYVCFQTIPSIDQMFHSMEFLESILTNFIACLGLVLVISFLIKLVLKHRPNPYEKLWSSISWFTGCTYSLYTQVNSQSLDANKALIAGLATTFLTFLIILFIEESIWSIKYIRDPKKTITR